MLMVSEYSENAWNMLLYENDYQFLDTLKTKDRKIKVDCNLLKKVKFHELEWSSSLTPRHWNQFADDAAVISRLESENQILLNLFSRWCSWVDMIIRVDKWHSFGIKRSGNSSKQYYLSTVNLSHQ